MSTSFKSTGLATAVATAINSMFLRDKNHSFDSDVIPYTMSASMLYNLDTKRLQASIVERLLGMDVEEKRTRVETLSQSLDAVSLCEKERENVYFIEYYYAGDLDPYLYLVTQEDIPVHRKKASVSDPNFAKSQNSMRNKVTNKKRTGRRGLRR